MALRLFSCGKLLIIEDKLKEIQYCHIKEYDDKNDKDEKEFIGVCYFKGGRKEKITDKTIHREHVYHEVKHCMKNVQFVNEMDTINKKRFFS